MEMIDVHRGAGSKPFADKTRCPTREELYWGDPRIVEKSLSEIDPVDQDFSLEQIAERFEFRR